MSFYPYYEAIIEKRKEKMSDFLFLLKLLTVKESYLMSLELTCIENFHYFYVLILLSMNFVGDIKSPFTIINLLFYEK